MSSGELQSIQAPGFILQDKPRIYVVKLKGYWLLKHTTPSWRIDDPEKGFQRIVRTERAKEIAANVLDQHRTFPNAIILATDTEGFEETEEGINVPDNAKFLVVDGQHRLWAQKFSEYEASFCCMLHMQLTEADMARLFLEINNNQRRVPASLRWDLVRLVQPEESQDEVAAAELTFQLAARRVSPLYQRIDLTGEQNEISLKQASVAPEIRTTIATRDSALHNLDFEAQFEVLIRYFAAIKSRDPDGWKNSESPLYGARVLRALIRLLPKIITRADSTPTEITVQTYKGFLDKLDLSTLDPDKIRGMQGSAGVSAIYDVIKAQVLGD